MSAPWNSLAGFIALLAGLCAQGNATVQILTLTPSVASPQPIGKVITFSATATDSNTGPLTFRFNVIPPGGTITMVNDFNVGTLSSGTWTAPPLALAPTSCANLTQSTGVTALICQPVEGTYQVQVIAKDFVSGQSANKIVPFTINPLVTGATPVAAKTANPLVALFSSPACPLGSTMRVSFQQQSKHTPATTTNWLSCIASKTMNFEIAGMYPQTTYEMFSQTNTGGVVTKGPTVNFTTGPLPTQIPMPPFTVVVSPGSNTDTADGVILHNPFQVYGTHYADVATDLTGKIIWYYYPNDQTNLSTLTRPLTGGTFLTIQDGVAWNPAGKFSQYLRQTDLAGNVIRETNTGIIQQELLALGAKDAASCINIPSPAPVGTACLGGFHHDAIQTLPNGGTALLADIEKIFPPGTQGNTTGLPVDIVGDIIIVLNSNWQVVWYFDAFEHDSGPPQLDINRPAVLGETCTNIEGTGCPPMFLMGPGIAPTAHDWLHANSLYYWPQDGDIIWSVRHQDWVVKIDYQNGSTSATGNILWRMGPSGDFTINNVNNDPWPWFSHQHEVGMENRGAGPLTLFDNGNTRISPPTGPGSSTGGVPGLGSNCGPNDCHSRGMSLTVDENTMQVTPLLNVDLGVYSLAMGSAQLLSDGNYFFLPAVVVLSISSDASYSTEILPTPNTITGTQVLNLQGPEHYRAWQMPSLYAPPIT